MKRKVLTTVAFTAFISVTALAAEPTDKDAIDRKPTASNAELQTYEAAGVVKKVDMSNQNVTIAHEPIASLNWPAMTMPFKVEDNALMQKLAVGKNVHFQLTIKNREYVITDVR